MPLTVTLYLFTREVYRYCIGIGWQQKTVYRYFKTVNVFNYGELNNQNWCICTWLAYGCYRPQSCVACDACVVFGWKTRLTTHTPTWICWNRTSLMVVVVGVAAASSWTGDAPTMSLFSYRPRRRTVCVKLLRRQYNSTWCDLRVPAAAFCTYQTVYLRRYSTD